MKKIIFFIMSLVLTLITIMLITPTAYAGTYNVGAKTITFEEFKPEGVEGEITGFWDYKDNSEGIIIETTEKVYHMKLDDTIKEITENEYNELNSDEKLLELSYDAYYAEVYEEPEEFLKELPNLEFVEGTGENTGKYAVKIGDNVVSEYIYTVESEIIENGTTYSGFVWEIGNVMLGIGKKENTEEFDLWINTKPETKIVTIEENNYFTEWNGFLHVFEAGDKKYEKQIIYDWSGNKLIDIYLENNNDYYRPSKIKTCGKEFIQVENIGRPLNNNSNDVYQNKKEIYDLNGNKILEAAEEGWILAFQFGIVDYRPNDDNIIKLIEIKNKSTISDTIKIDDSEDFEWLELYATTAELKNTEEDYLAPGKYYFSMWNENKAYVMTISYRVLEGANATIDKSTDKELTVKVDGDIEKLEGIYVDDIKLNEENYTLTKGSTIVTLKEEYLENLETGEYNLKVKYVDGEVETKFKITNNVEIKDEISKGEKDDTPKTGYVQTKNNIVTYVIIVLLTLGSVCVIKKK